MYWSITLLKYSIADGVVNALHDRKDKVFQKLEVHPCIHRFHNKRDRKSSSIIFPKNSPRGFIHMFDELGMAVYETIGRIAFEDGEQEVPGDDGRVEAILDLRVIEEQLRQLIYAIHELMEESIGW